MKKTVGGPKRFRPPTREELLLQHHTMAQKVAALTHTVKKLQVALARCKGGGSGAATEAGSVARGGGGGGAAANDSDAEESSGGDDDAGDGAGAQGERAGAAAPVALLREVEELRVAVAAKEGALREVVAEVERLEEELRDVKGCVRVCLPPPPASPACVPTAAGHRRTSSRSSSPQRV